jgi:peptidoglycan-N-acetylglucosamine deacetylase
MRKAIIWGSSFWFLSMLGGLIAAMLIGHVPGLEYEKADDFLDVPIEFQKTYLGPIDKRWAKYVDNHLPAIIHCGTGTSNRIALTFDDGPHPESTYTLLEILKTFNIKATFFVVGTQAEKYPDLIKKIYEAGHEIGNHTYTHPDLTRLSREDVTKELEQTRTIIFNQTGFIPCLFRPPGGRFDDNTLSIARELNYSTVFWTINSGDWQKMTTRKLTSRILDYNPHGAIILMHNSDFSSTLTALPDILQKLKAEGYEFTTVSGLLRQDK